MKKIILACGVLLVILVTVWWLSKPWLPFHDPHLADGVKVRLMQGSVKRPGLLVFQMALPPHFVFPTHFHDVEEELTLVSGSMYLGGMDGKPFSCNGGTRFDQGNTHKLPATVHHWGYTTDTPVVVEVRSRGPYTIHWVQSDPLKPCH